MVDETGLVERLREPYSQTQSRRPAVEREAADRIEALQQEVERLRGVAEQGAMALNSFIHIIAHRFDGDGTYYWMRDPTHEEAQAAMAANNATSTALQNGASNGR